jgi:serine/threonine protein kinase
MTEMAITAPLVLPTDVVLVPVEELPAAVRSQVEYEAGDYAITRPRSRTPSKIIDPQAAALLKKFRSPNTIVEAVISFSREQEMDPEQTLIEAFPMIQQFVQARLLVSVDSAEAHQIEPSLATDDQIAEFDVLRCIQALEDTELYQVRFNQGTLAALKIERPGRAGEMRGMLDREAAILRHLDGSINPTLLQTGTFEDRGYLVIQWCPGISASVAAEELRGSPGARNRQRLLRLCCTILEAYAHLHAQHVIHSDVHPQNVLVDAEGAVKIIDYGLARLETEDGTLGKSQRGGIGFFFEPEYAQAYRDHHRVQQSSKEGEQYALAALLYFLLTGAHYLDFSLEKHEMFRQIAEEPPLPFSRRHETPWPEVEECLGRALSKNPANRFSSVAEFANRLHQIVAITTPDDPPSANVSVPREPAALDALLAEVLQRVGFAGQLLASGVTVPPTCSVNYGAAGIAYALYRVACIRSDPSLLSLADLWLTKAQRGYDQDTAFYNPEIDITPEGVGQISPYHTASGIHCVQALIGHAMGDLLSQHAAIEAFVGASNAPCENLDLTLGRSSTLIVSSLLLDVMPDNALLRELGDRTIQAMGESQLLFADP